MRSILAVVFLAFLLVSTQAFSQEFKNCLPPSQMKAVMNAGAMVRFSYGITNEGYLFSIYIGDGIFVLMAEDEGIACVLAVGKELYGVRGENI